MKQLSGKLTALYLIGGICAISSLVFTLFSLYIIPHVFFDSLYPIPKFLIHLGEWLQAHHNITGFVLSIATVSPFIIFAIFFAVASKAISRRFDMQTLDVTDEQATELRWQPGWRRNIMIILLAAVTLLLLTFLLDFVIIIDELSHLPS